MIGDLRLLIDKVRPFMMVPSESLAEFAWQVRLVLEHETPGDFGECGTGAEARRLERQESIGGEPDCLGLSRLHLAAPRRVPMPKARLRATSEGLAERSDQV
jgi:hypothetical protein